MSKYSGKLLLRMPTELHRRLDLLATRNKTSINQYIVNLLANSEFVSNFTETTNPGEHLEKILVKEERPLGQDASTGRRGNEVGRIIGQSIAHKLNINLEPGSNKGLLNGRTVVIKSARKGNNLFGITNRMAEDIEDVILAKEIDEGYFELYRVKFNTIKDSGRPTRSKGSSSGKVTNYSLSEAISKGVKFASIKVDLPY